MNSCFFSAFRRARTSLTSPSPLHANLNVARPIAINVIEQSVPSRTRWSFFSCQDAIESAGLDPDANKICCKGIFGGTEAGDEPPRVENATNPGTFDNLPNFLPHGCLCIDDIYDEDREFFDAVVEFVNAAIAKAP